MRSVLSVHWKYWCWSWSSNTLATWCEELTPWKRPWCWERLKVGREGGDRGWDGWMASPTQWTWVQVKSGSWWWTGRPCVLQFTGTQTVRHDWVTELNWKATKAAPVPRSMSLPRAPATVTVRPYRQPQQKLATHQHTHRNRSPATTGGHMERLLGHLASATRGHLLHIVTVSRQRGIANLPNT